MICVYNKRWRNIMNIHHYKTNGGKDLILEYIDGLPKNEKAEGLVILEKLAEDGLEALNVLNTRQLRGKLWEIKFYNKNRIMYIIADIDNMYIVHACKNKREKLKSLN